jgi:uncharacterized membrane protein
MGRGRLEAFSDGVLAIVLTIMVLEMKVPRGTEWATLQPLIPVFLSYLLSFVYIGIYWNNHHHMMLLVPRVNGGILWANLHLLFWLSLIPFVTGWMGSNHLAPVPTALYALVLLANAIAYTILQFTIIRAQGDDSPLAKALGKDNKGRISIGLYVTSIIFAFFVPWISAALFLTVAIYWLVPDKRIEAVLPAENPDEPTPDYNQTL